VRGGDSVTVLVPHAAEVPPTRDDDGVAVRSFRYAPVRAEVFGYGRSLEADERPRLGAAAVSPLYAAGLWRGLRRELGAARYDLLHAHWIVPNGVVAALPGVGRRLPLAVGLHGSDVFLAEKGVLRPLVRRTLRVTRLLTGCSPELVERVVDLGFRHELSRVIPYGVDVDTFRPAADRRLLWRRRLGIPERAVVVLALGRMATKKGFHVLVDALPAVLEGRETADDVHVVLAGDGDRRAELEARCRRFAPRVHFPGAVQRDTLPDLYRAADLFVLPAVHDARGNVDGLPNVILEAMASGLPVVATRVSGIPLAVSSGREGVLVEEGSVSELAQAITRFVVDGEARARAGHAGRTRAQEELTWDVVAGRYRQAYEAALA